MISVAKSVFGSLGLFCRAIHGRDRGPVRNLDGCKARSVGQRYKARCEYAVDFDWLDA
jgi:hypothetical protein